MQNKALAYKFLFLALALMLLSVMNLSFGSVSIPFSSVLKLLGNSDLESVLHQTILRQVRLPELLTAITAGAGLGLSGLLLQTLFRNPLTGPSILGITSGASLGVALVLLSGVTVWFGGSALLEGFSISLAGMLGALFVLLIIVLIARKMTSLTALLIVGLMMGYLVSAMVSVLLYYSDNESIQSYVFWGMGSFSDVKGIKLIIQTIVVVAAITCVILRSRVLNVLILGDKYAQNLGVNVKREHVIVIVISGVLAGVITAYCGPIAFLGMAIPHLVRSWFKTGNHFVLVPGVFLTGASLALLCNIIADSPWSESALPLNAITPLFGAPVVIAIIFKRKQYLA